MGPRPQDMKAVIREANNRPAVHGILVYYPIFVRREQVRRPYKNRLTGVYEKSHDDDLRDLVSAENDVEGLCQAYNARWLPQDRIASMFKTVLNLSRYRAHRCPWSSKSWMHWKRVLMV